ncbi:hypothetical protein ACHIPZ_15175 [Antrihabitans sp. NCIMB 15449]|uniref:Abi-like protein n=1 Tax=Antrihabitans spumae TaxID=3373370 RepID=A0ABW7JNE1_9NOCA
MSSTGPAPWSNAVIADLLTRQRLSSYLNATNSDLDRAICLYEWNTEAAAGVLSLAAMTEVVVRNAMDVSLRRWSRRHHRMETWFDHAPLDARGLADIADARSRAIKRQPAEIHGKVIAELSFGFWRYLAGSRYLTSLWIPALRYSFPEGHPDIGRRRKDVERRLQRLAFVRNRAAHHEPIHQRKLIDDVADAVALAAWVSPDAAAWIQAKEPVTGIYLRKP